MAKNIVNLNVDGTVYTSRPFGTCSTAAATTAKEVSCADFALTSGATVLVKFTYANTASSPTLNVNSTGAKKIYYRGAALASSLYYWGAGDLVEFYYDGTQWNLLNVSNSDNNTYPSAYCATAAATAAKSASCTNYVATANTYLHVLVVYANSSAGAITLNVNGKGAKPIYINGVASSSTNYALPAGSYIVYYDGTNYQFRTDGILPGKILKASDADTVNGKTVLSDVPANAKFTDTNTKVTSVSNHYEPESTSTDTLSIDASGATTSASWGSTNLVTGIDILRDAKGHVTGINVDSIKMPGNPNTTYSAGKGLTLSSTTFNVGAGNGIAVADDTVSANLRSTTKLTNDSAAATETSGRIYPVALDKSGYLAVNVPWKNDDTKYGADRGITLVNSKYGHSNTAIAEKTTFVDTDADASISVATNGGSFKVTDVTYDAYGHITGSQDRTITLSESKKGTVTSITLTQGDGITVSSSGTAITSSGTRTISLNAATSDTIGGIKVGYTTSGKNYKVQLDSNNNAYVNVPWTDNNTDTKNTAGTTEKLDTKLFLVGATSQDVNPQTYSNTKVYIGSNNCLYSNGTKVSVEGHTHNYLSSLPTHTHSYTELTGSVADAADQAIVSSGTANGWKLYSLKSAAQKTATTSVSSSSTDSQVPTAKAVYSAITSSFAANDAMIFKGTLGTNSGDTVSALPSTTAKTGWTYRVTTAGTYDSKVCEIGDLIICLTDGSSSTAAKWTVAQTNIDGAVTGPSSSTDGHIVVFNGTSGKSIKSSGKTIANLTYSSGTGLSLSNNTFSLATSGVTKGTYGPSAAVTGSEGSTISVPQITVDEYGRVTGIANKTYTSKNTTYTAGTGLSLSNNSFSLATVTNLTAGDYGNTSQQTPSHGGTFNIPYYTVDDYGRITKAGTTTVKLPGSGNTDTKVNVTLATTSKAYLIGVTSTPTSTATAMTAVSDTGVYLDTTAGTLTATAFNGNASSATYATNARVTATTTAGTYYPTWTSGTTANTNYVLRGNSNFKYNIVAGTTSAEGYDSIYLGNSTAKGTANNSTGRILLYSSSSGYHTLVGAATTGAIGHTLPTTGGTILNTGTTSVTQKQTSGTEIATIKINNSDTKIYAPSISLSLGTEASNTTAGTFVKSIAVSGHTITVTKYTGTLGDGDEPIYLNAGVPTKCSVYAGGTAVTLNGVSKAASTASFYAPTGVGTAGQILVSNGSGAPSWQDCGGKVKSTTAAVAIATSWGTLLSAANLGTLCDSTVGTYAIQIYGPSSIGYSSGVFTWNSTNSGDANEILLHRTGASTSIYLRMATDRTLQIAGSAAVSSSTITIKVKRLI